MKTIEKIEVIDCDITWDLEEEFWYEDAKLVINGLRNYRGINDDMNVEDFDANIYNIVPIYATIHGGISFHLHKGSKWDSGIAGFIAYRKNVDTFKEEDIDYLLEKLDSIYNGWVKEVTIVTYDICECCGNEKYGGALEGDICFTNEETQEAIELFEKFYNLKYEVE